MNETKTTEETSVARILGVALPGGRIARLKRWLIWGVPVVLAALGVALWLMSGNGDQVRYQTHTVQRGNLTVTVTATGNLKPTNQVDVGSELSGIVKSVEADYNQRVKVGQVLARLDTSKLEAQVSQTRAALESAQAKVLQARASALEARSELARLKRVQELSGGKVPSQADLDKAEATLKRAEADETSATAEVARAQATLKANETDLTKAVIRSPITGIVLSRAVEPGQTVAATFQAPVLFTLAEDLRKMELHVDVDEADVGQVKAGQEASFTVDAYPERSFNARITQVRFGSKTVEGVVTYETVLNVDNAELLLRPGMTATADLTVKRIENALLVPNAALRFTPPQPVQPEAAPSGGFLSRLIPHPPAPTPRPPEESAANRKQQRVWTVQDGQLVAVPVTVGATDGTLTEVTGGELNPGTAVVVDTVGARQ
jgi:HlyD family secretion protein